VARLLTAGHSNRDLAQTLGMAPDKVKWHLKKIFGKLGVSNRTQAVLRRQEIGLGSNAPRSQYGPSHPKGWPYPAAITRRRRDKAPGRRHSRRGNRGGLGMAAGFAPRKANVNGRAASKGRAGR
jgi:hypothetical protein